MRKQQHPQDEIMGDTAPVWEQREKWRKGPNPTHESFRGSFNKKRIFEVTFNKAAEKDG